MNMRKRLSLLVSILQYFHEPAPILFRTQPFFFGTFIFVCGFPVFHFAVDIKLICFVRNELFLVIYCVGYWWAIEALYLLEIFNGPTEFFSLVHQFFGGRIMTLQVFSYGNSHSVKEMIIDVTMHESPSWIFSPRKLDDNIAASWNDDQILADRSLVNSDSGWSDVVSPFAMTTFLHPYIAVHCTYAPIFQMRRIGNFWHPKRIAVHVDWMCCKLCDWLFTSFRKRR